jgi:hypothetical protein
MAVIGVDRGVHFSSRVDELSSVLNLLARTKQDQYRNLFPVRLAIATK